MVIGFSVPVKGFFNFYGKKQKWKKNLLFCVNSVTKDISYRPGDRTEWRRRNVPGRMLV